MFSAIVPVSANETIDAIAGYQQSFEQMLVSEHGIEFAQNYTRSVEMLSLLVDSFPRNRMGEFETPSNFGGVYIDDYGALNLLIVEHVGIAPLYAEISDAMIAVDNFAASALRDESVNVRTVQFSYQMLWDTQNLLNDFVW